MVYDEKLMQEILAELKELRKNTLPSLHSELKHSADTGQLLKEILELHKANNQMLSQIISCLNDFQGILDFAAGDDKNRNHRLTLSDIKSELVKLRLLMSPDQRDMYRGCSKSLPVEDPQVTCMSKPYLMVMAQNSSFGDMNPLGRAFYRIGFQSNVPTASFVRINDGITSEVSLSGEVLRLVSTSASDSASGTGVRTVLIHGVDPGNKSFTEIVALNGTTPVNTVNTFIRADSLFASTVGSNGFAVGTISLTNPAGTLTYGNMLPGNNAWKSGTYYTDGFQVAYIHQWAVSSYGTSIRFELFSSGTGGYTTGAPLGRQTASVNGASFYVNFPVPVRVAKQGVIFTRGIAKNAANEATCAFELTVRSE